VGTSGRHYNHVVIEDDYDSDSPPLSPNQLLSPLFEDLEVSSTHATTLPARQSSSGMPGGGDRGSGVLPKVTVQRRRGPSDRFRKFRERIHSAEPPATVLRLLVNEEYENRQTRKLLVTAFEHLQRETQHAKELEAKNNTVEERFKALNSARLTALRASERKAEEIRGYQMQLANAQREIQRAEVSLRALEKERNDAQEEAGRVRAKLRKMHELWSAHAAREEGRRAGFEEGMRVGRQVGYKVGHEFGRDPASAQAIDRVVYEDEDDDVDQDTDNSPIRVKAGSHHRDRPDSLSMATAERFEDLGTQSDDDSSVSGLETPRANHTPIRPEVSPPPLPVPRPPSRPRHETPVSVRPQSIPPDNFVPSMNEAGAVPMPAPHAFNTPSPNDSMGDRPPANYNPYPIPTNDITPEPVVAPAPSGSRTRPRRGTYSSAGLDTDVEPESLASVGQSSSFSQYDLVTESPYTTDRRDYATRNFERQLSVIHEDRSSRGSPSVAPSLRPRDSRPMSVQPDRMSLNDVPPPPPIRTPSSAGLGWPNRAPPSMSREASIETLNRPSSTVHPPPGQIYKQEAPEFRYPTPVERNKPPTEDPRYLNTSKIEQWRAASVAEVNTPGSLHKIE
jgi:hypothetical protein